MKLCRFLAAGSSTPSIGLTTDDRALLDLSTAGISRLSDLLDWPDLPSRIRELAARPVRTLALGSVRLLPPVEQQEIWAAGVTYLRSKTARMEESDFSATAYDRVYDAPRPEIFFKALASKVVTSGDCVGIRRDAKWNVPEPELALVMNSRAELVGYAVGNDMSSRDIEGENLLYLPQAKVYDRSCAIGPFIVVGASEPEAREWTIGIRISRGGSEVFAGQTRISQIKRTFDELVGWLKRSQTFPTGAVLFTGTGVVPPNDFTLAENDRIQIQISGIGTLENDVVIV